ncbi:hypothetical protein [Hymenobacter sp. CRA2]|uniref:hypothetical protein n=1 Tax=Hymenobacter sp. CRA2 TaxID=1955620 RepID=UPI00098F7871|nr:hypothetical protein [Hymenobacter sp. CRA2]OON66959.1 hypothetical protein B0919_20470 [Hymenobacter sp. CRA2]
MLRRLLLVACVGGLGILLYVVVAAPFMVTWGHPKDTWVKLAMLICHFPVPETSGPDVSLWPLVLNSVIWALGLYALYAGLKQATRRIVALAKR